MIAWLLPLSPVIRASCRWLLPEPVTWNEAAVVGAGQQHDLGVGPHMCQGGRQIVGAARVPALVDTPVGEA